MSIIIMSVYVPLVMQHSKSILRITFPSVACPSVLYFTTLFHKRRDLRKRVFEHKMCVLIFSINLFEIFLILRRIQQDTVTNVHRCRCKVPAILVRF